MKLKHIIAQCTQPKQAIPLAVPSTPKHSIPCSCGCIKVKAVPNGNTEYYARWNCCNCARFRGWIRKPTSLTAQQTENELIGRLLTSGKLTAWEIGFCHSVKGQKKRSPRPKRKLEEISKRLGISANRLGGQEQIAGAASAHLLSFEGGER